MKWLKALPLLAFLACSIASCTNAELKCISGACKAQAVSPPDDIIQTTGEFCTADPNTQVYPYKILFVVDTSESTIYSDPTKGRGRAIQAVLDKYGKDPSVWFALITFTDTPTAVVPKFTQDLATMEAAIPQTNLGIANTNYLDTLAMARQLIDADAKSLPAATRNYTRYDVEWLSDGNPELDQLQPNLTAVCAQTLPAVHDAEESLMALQQQDNFFSITLSTIYLDSPVVSACAPLVSTNPTLYGTGAQYLQQMTKDGGGTFQDEDSNNLSFNINFTSIVRPYQKHSFYLVNHSRVVSQDSLLADSDQDGVADSVEATDGTSPLSADPNNTGCSDRTNQLLLPNQGLCTASCMNPANNVPVSQTTGATTAGTTPAGGTATGATTTGVAPTTTTALVNKVGVRLGPTVAGNNTTLLDSDQDLLHDCEEAALGTNRALPDSDGDGLLDEIETRFGTNPLDPKTVSVDTDLDGVTDMQEVFNGTDPLTPQTTTDLAYSYAALTAGTDTTPARTCYNFTISNVRLAPTIATPTSAAGDNDICLYVLQSTVDDPNSEPTVTRACKTANYQVIDGKGEKMPANSVLQFTPADFVPVMCPGGVCPTTTK